MYATETVLLTRRPSLGDAASVREGELAEMQTRKQLSRQKSAYRSSMIALGALLLSVATTRAQQPARSGGAPPPANMALFQQGTAALQANRPEEAIRLLQQFTQMNPKFAEGYLNLGLAYARESRSEEAIASLEKGLTLKPSMRGANLFLAISEYKSNRLDRAATAARKETLLNSKDAQAWLWKGIIDLARSELTESVDDLDRASSLEPNNVDILYHRGRAALALSRHSYEEMFRIDPQSWHVHQVLAEADVESGNDADAIEQFKTTIASAPPQSGLYESLGSAYWRTGKYPEAQEAYERAIKIDPNDIVALYKLGCLRIDRSDAAGGKPLLEQVRAADPSLTMTSYYLGRAEFQLGNDNAAIADFQQSIKEHPGDETAKQAYFQLSRVYRRAHNLAASEEAQAQYRLLDQKNRDTLQEKLNQRRLRGDRDTSIPVSATEPNGQGSATSQE